MSDYFKVGVSITAYLYDQNPVTGLPVTGNTSLSYVHRMHHADGREIASLLQVGVQLDLDARRPTAIPPAIREAIAKL